MNARAFRFSLTLALLVFSFSTLSISQKYSVVKLLAFTEQDKIEKYLELIIKNNKPFLEKLCVQEFGKNAQDWLKRYLNCERSQCNMFTANITGSYYLKNVHPYPGNELCIETDEGLLLIGLDGRLLGEIRYPDCQTSMSRVHFIDIDPPDDSTRLDEVIVKGSQQENNVHSTLYIFKWIDEEYRIVFKKQLKESLAAKGVVHAILEHVGFALIEDKFSLRINDEGDLEYYVFINGIYVCQAELDK